MTVQHSSLCDWVGSVDPMRLIEHCSIFPLVGESFAFGGLLECLVTDLIESEIEPLAQVK